MRLALFAVIFTLLGVTAEADTNLSFDCLGTACTLTITTTGCANQLVLQYSNTCALIGQAWGQ